ncbi:MAG: AMP-binding protein, partial [bacterium]|nr:AMP-binding protein [bacterium]
MEHEKKNNIEGESVSVDSSQRYTDEEHYWLNKLSGELKKIRIPYDYEQTAGSGIGVVLQLPAPAKYRNVEFSFHGQLYANLMTLCNNSHPRLHMILLTALYLLLEKYTGNEDIIVGVPIFKQEIEAEFINTILPLRNRVKGDMTFKELLLQVRETITEADKNQNYPIEMLLQKLKLPFIGDFPLFDTALLLKSIHEREYLDPANPKIVFSFSVEAGSIEGELEYDAGLSSDETVKRIADYYTHLLKGALSDINVPISGIEILPEEEKKRLLFEFNDTSMEYPGEKRLPELFEQQVKKTPGNIAVKFKNETLTYKQLNEKANRLARILRKKGARRENIVAVIIKPSLDVVVALLAILKTGGAYMPLDPESPRDRVLEILRDSGVSLVLTKVETSGTFSFTSLRNLRTIRVKPRLNSPREQIKDFDSVPIPDRSLVDYAQYHRYIAEAPAKHTVTIQGTRGCPFECAFCHKIWSKNHVFRSAENLYGEIKKLYDVGVRRFEYVDDIFNLNKKNSRRFFELIIKNGLKVNLFFTSGLRGDILTKDDIDLMVEAGTVDFDFSLESACPRIQDVLRKYLKIDKLKENIEYIIKKHPGVIIELQTMHGIPTETEEEALMTLDFIKELKWIDFPYVHLLRIFPETEMTKIALDSGVSMEAIEESADLAFHELSATLPFSREFTKLYQSRYLHEYFLLKERFLSVLPKQMRILTEDELVQKYDSFFPTDIGSFPELLEVIGIKREELGGESLPEDYMSVPDINEKLKKAFPQKEPASDALRVLLLDISLYFSDGGKILYDVVNEPLGLIYVLTSLQNDYGEKIHGKIAKSRIDFNSYSQLESLLHEFKPDVIGIRSMSFYKDFFHLTVSLIRQWGLDVPIIAGGPYATSNHDMILRDKNVDLVVLGEGESTFSEVIGKILENNGELPGDDVLEGINGIAFMDEPGRNRLEKLSREILLMDEAAGPLAEESAENLEIDGSSSDLAYIIFTSGSTGRPKGVMVENRNVNAYLNAYFRDIGITETDTSLIQSSYAFDAYVEELYPALLKGAAAAIATREDILDPQKLAAFIKDNNITVFGAAPLLLNELNKIYTITPMESIHTVISGMDMLLQNYIDNLLKTTRVFNTYGPTETTVCAAYYRCSPGDKGGISIGTPIANYKIYILNNRLNPLPIGAPGEICISGHGVTRGYLNRPALTRERFVDNPFLEGERLYKTGDLARWQSDGNIKFLGRIDSQVKIRGYRIEPGEIENRLNRIEYIKQCAVTAREDKFGEKYLCAYYTAETDKEIDLGELKKKLK